MGQQSISEELLWIRARVDLSNFLHTCIESTLATTNIAQRRFFTKRITDNSDPVSAHQNTNVWSSECGCSE
jgi:hypothetical protein